MLRHSPSDPPPHSVNPLTRSERICGSSGFGSYGKALPEIFRDSAPSMKRCRHCTAVPFRSEKLRIVTWPSNLFGRSPSSDRARRERLVGASQRKCAPHRFHPRLVMPCIEAKRISSPSTMETTLISASHSFSARSPIVSSTGWMSVGELEITRNTSEVAVCCSKTR